MEAHRPVAPESDVRSEVRTPWLAFSIHHGARAHDEDDRHERGLILAAEASLRGSMAVLVGPSGAGKTSLLRSIAGLMRPERGEISIAGTTVWDSARGIWLRPAARGCGLVTQRPALFPAMTARDNIAFGLHALPREERERRVRQMAALFRLEAVLSRRPAQLSGGEQQRVAVARTLAPHPRVVLLDEPFAGLNLALKDAILTDLESWLSGTRTPVLHVTHDVAEAWRLGLRQDAEVLRIEGGRIIKQGPAAVVLVEERSQLLRALE
ncbi:MAG TPA: ATP-binding cassette domain-containing protein [Acidobacteriaceae bacterium]|jgi:ABC-type sulfate/molybdate transport systems ATPase subunit